MAATVSVKRVLVFTYSQSGQLSSIVDRILGPLVDSPHVEVHVEPVRLLRPHPFPWSLRSFLDAFPESALMRPQALAPLGLQGDEDFDLVILPYQVWFLAPSLPISSLLQRPEVQRLLAGKPVVTVIGCRNMWLMAHHKMKQLLAQAGARLLDNVVLTDNGPMAATLVTTPMWMLTGRREGWFGLPPAGISPQDIAGSRRFGLALRDALAQDLERGQAPMLSGLKAVQAQPRLWASERAGTRSFALWGRLIQRVGAPGAPQRVPLLALYLLVLLCLILTVLPVSTLLQAALRPWRAAHEARLKTDLEAPSGHGDERMALYDS
jgi:hypothetical protein